MAYCNWAYGVNKRILDSTSLTVGDGAVVQDSLESGGLKKSRLACSNPPDKFAVTMDFDSVEPVYNGYTELELFWIWYKNVHKFGTVPFEFPAILINSNRMKGNSQEELSHIIRRIENNDETAVMPDTEYYCITSALSSQKSGYSQRISMTWETYATGSIQIDTEEAEIERLEAENGVLKVVLTDVPSPLNIPNAGTWTVEISSAGSENSPLEIISSYYDGDNCVYLLFNKLEIGTYNISIDDKSTELEVE